MNEYVLIGASILLLISVLVSKISDRFGIPVLLLFLILGMLAGSDGLGGIYFDDPEIAQLIGILALVIILFSGGLSTEWDQVRPVVGSALLLSTLGVLITAITVGFVASSLLKISFLEGFLLGSIVSSTDAAAVFSVLRSKGVSLKGNLKPLLELESGSNDPMAIFLTIGLIQLISQPNLSPLMMFGLFFQQMIIGVGIGYGMGKVMSLIINRIKLGYEGLYPVLTLSLVIFTFGLTDLLGGNGFLAVYLAGIILRKQGFLHQKSLASFHDGLAWIMQITMFLTLGLLVFPSRLVPIIDVGLLIAGFLMLIARPLSVFICLLPSKFGWREKTFVAWVGLRGAAPIILATFPLIAQIKQANLIFNVVFFVVLTSVLFQGTSLPLMAKWLKVDAPIKPKRIYPIEYVPVGGLKSELKELLIPKDSSISGKAIYELGLPDDFLIILIAREDDFMVPSGGTILKDNDTLLVLSEKKSFDEVLVKLKL